MTKKTIRYIDLHTHTNYSDGSGLSPKLLVETAAYKGIDILAKTDHDTIRGYGEALREAERFGITLVPGVEITTKKYHLLTLNFNLSNKRFKRFLEYSEELQEEACKKRVEILRDYGVPINFDKVREEFPESRLGKFNIFIAMQTDKNCRQYLKERYPEMSPSEIFKFYFGKKGVASNMRYRPAVNVGEAILEAHLANGMIGIAHPCKDIDEMEEMDRLVNQGIDFIEVQPDSNGKYSYNIFKDYAKRNNLLITYGSDYHGPISKNQMYERRENILSKSLEMRLFDR